MPPSLVDVLRSQLTVHQKRRIAYARMRLRLPLAAWRRLPDLVVVGAQRGGTSSLYRYLGGHPDVRPSVRKETEYFSRGYDRGPAWYRSHFPLRRSGMTFEATPDYLFHPLTPARISSDIPGCRIVVLLRNPAERAVSHWEHMTRLGFEKLSFADALEAEPERTDADRRRLESGELVDAGPLLRFSYRARGDYASQLERWLAVFPRPQVLVLRSEDLFSDPESVLHEVEDFAGVARWTPTSFVNWSAPEGLGTELPVMPLAAADRVAVAELRVAFEPDNARLATLLGTEPWWPATSR